jgi:hypothetical protein
MPEIELGGISFTSKAQLKSLVRGIASHYDNRQALRTSDFDIVRALLDHHPNASALIDCGVKRIEVRGGRFILVRKDSSIAEFPWTPAFRNLP